MKIPKTSQFLIKTLNSATNAVKDSPHFGANTTVNPAGSFFVPIVARRKSLL